MIIDFIADLHGFAPELPGGELLILAGDMTASDRIPQWVSFFRWLKDQPYRHKVMIAGNHDNFFEKGFPKDEQEARNIAEIQAMLEYKEDFIYLCDSGTEIEGLKLWGTPWTTWFPGVNPQCKAFMDSESYLDKRFELIPEGLDILISHGPPYKILDKNKKGAYCGSFSLRSALAKAKPQYHAFGHIHECGGNRFVYKNCGTNTVCINCSYVNGDYEPVFSHQRIEL